MSVENLKVIDFASIDKNGNAVLTISDHLKWDNSNDHLQILQNKINAYLSAIETGSFYDDYPDAKDRNIVISVIAKYKPNGNAKLFLDGAKETLQSAGYEFRFSLLEND